MKRIEVYFTPEEAGRASLEGRQIVVVDVLRTCSSIATALRNGAAKVIPVETVEEAKRLAETLDPKSRLLCGEREGKKMGGFDLGNSPAEYVRERVEGATLVFASTNASPLMAGQLNGREQRLLSYVNLTAVADAVRRDGNDVAILCAGRKGGFALDDAACAGALVRRLADFDLSTERNDAAEMARAYDLAHGHDPAQALRLSAHGRYLAELGFDDDIATCAAVDSVPVVPFLKDGRITSQAPV